MSDTIWGYIKNYKWKSVFFRYWRLTVLALIIPLIIINIFAYNYYRTIYEKEITSANAQTLLKIQSSMDMIVNDLNKLSTVLSLNSSAQLFLTSPQALRDGFNSSQIAFGLWEAMSGFSNSNNYIHSIHLYRLDEQYVFSTQGSNYLENFYDTSLLDIYASGTGNGFYPREVGGHKYITMLREVYTRNSSSVVGVLFINIDMEELKKIINNSHPDAIEKIYITDASGKIIYSNDFTEINTTLEFANSPTNNVFISSIDSEQNDWIYTLFTYAGNPLWQAWVMQSLLILFLAVLGASLLSFYVSVKLYASITDIISVIDDPMGGDINGKYASSFNEIRYISKNIVGMMDKNKKIETELTSMLLVLRKNQAIALQTQIAPHFIFNTLQAINMLSLSITKGDNEVTRAISLLSALLEISLDTKEYLVPLSLEIEHANKYLQIQNIKYKNRFNVTWDISEDALRCKTLKLVLQPLIENSIRHGIIPYNSSGEIIINAYTQNSSLILKVKDKGVGIPPDELKVLNQTLSENKFIKESKNIGLSNVDQRIKLVFGEKYGVEIESVYQAGTTITLTMPQLIDKGELA